MRILLGTTVALLGTAAAFAQDDRQLIDQAARDLGAAPAAAQVTDEVEAEEQAARAQLAVAQARVALIDARKALKAGRTAQARTTSLRVLDLLAGMPDEIDVDAYRLQAEGILARLGQGEARVAGQRTEVPPSLSHEVTRRIVSEYSGAIKPELPTDAATWGYQPGYDVVQQERVFERDRQRLFYEGGLREAIRSDEMRRLVEGEEARIAPSADITYPPDWQARVARRAQYEGGEIARSESRTGPNGEEWFVSIYDISDLTYVPPQFTNSPVLDLWTAQMRAENLGALRQRSFIFGGYPEDLAAGLPLLAYLGGTDARAFTGPVYSAQRQAEIVNMITAFTSQQQGAMILSQP